MSMHINVHNSQRSDVSQKVHICIFQISKLSREEVERDLEFLGLVVLENRLKQPTASVITELREANIRVVMITGLTK